MEKMNRKLFLMAIAVLVVLTSGLVGSVAGAMAGLYISQPKPTLAATPLAPLTPVGNGFTYQGRLTNGGSPANGSHDLRFSLFDAVSGGNQIGSIITQTASLTDGLFTATLDFGSTAFLGDARFLN